MTETTHYDIDELPCGTQVADLVDAAAGDAELPPHARSCPICQDWVAGFRRRWSAVRAEAATDIPVPAGLFDSIRAWVRNDVKLVRSSVEGEYDGGRLRVSARVLLAFIRGAVGRDEDVFALSASVEDDDAITVKVAVEYGTSIPVVAEIVRRRAMEEYERALGRRPHQVHVHVEDLLDED